MPTTLPIPKQEIQRLLSLAELDVDYTAFNESFKHLSQLFAKIAGAEISLINLIDTSTQWSISNFGIDADQMPREDSVCQYTIMGDDYFEIDNLSADDRFKDKFYVSDPYSLNYYFGFPLKTADGSNIGAICVLDKTKKVISKERIEMLRIIADEVANRLTVYQNLLNVNKKVAYLTGDRKKLAHDIRSPLAGIIGLTDIIIAQGNDNTISEVLEFVSLINKSSRSLIDFADEILSGNDGIDVVKENNFTLAIFKDKLEKLFLPQAKYKEIDLYVNVDEESANISFPKNKLLQIASNLISNAIKFTPIGGVVNANIDLRLDGEKDMLYIIVSDSGVGMKPETITNLLAQSAYTTEGTQGEKGYGLGLTLVKHLVDQLKGSMQIDSKPDQGTRIEIKLAVYGY